MSTVIKVESLSKRYTIGHQKQAGYETFRETLTQGAKSVLRASLGWIGLAPRTPGGTTEEFWALKDVTFDVTEGDRVGIIGRNGAGKSTLLKILSRITVPSKGRVSIKGRMASLLEVGTGFHPELTGRENIYLNGAILGMSRAEVQRKFDEIVDFAEIERFLDTPVKRYSSGMYVRLAFAVAAHLEPDILIVDEVLAVGDAQFQKKCLSRMDDVASTGRTILFVSHNMNAIEQLCNKILVLDRGRVVECTEDVRRGIQSYFGGQVTSGGEWINKENTHADENFIPRSFRLIDQSGNVIQSAIRNDDDVFVEIVGEVAQADVALCVGYAAFSEDGLLLYWTYHTDGPEVQWPKLASGIWRYTSKLPKRVLNQGKYRIEMIATLHYRRWILQPGHDVPSLWMAIDGGLSDSPYWMVKRPGLLGVNITWQSGPIVQSPA